MGIVLGALIFLLLFQLLGDVTARWLNLPLPGPVVGMLGLLVVLVIRGGVPEKLRATSNTLLKYLMLLLVPATTGVMTNFNRLAGEWLAIVLAGVGGAAVTLAVTALTLHLLLARGRTRAMTQALVAIWLYLSVSPLLWIAVTLVAYWAAYGIYRRSGLNPAANPVLISAALIICVLLLTRTAYQTYFDAAQFVHFLVGPATVALAIPLYAQLDRLKTMFLPLAVALLVGSLTAIGSAMVIGLAFGASIETLLSLAPKSATMPIAMGVSEKIGGLPSLTALTVTITGISGAIMAPWLLNLMAVEDSAVRGFAVGLTAHAIGTSAVLQISETAGAFAALGMGLNGVATTLLLPLILEVTGSR